jgi:hypothetical protein
MRVETELAALASLATAVPEVLAEDFRFRRRFSGIKKEPPKRPVLVSPVRQENKDACPHSAYSLNS